MHPYAAALRTADGCAFDAASFTAAPRVAAETWLPLAVVLIALACVATWGAATAPWTATAAWTALGARELWRHARRSARATTKKTA